MKDLFFIFCLFIGVQLFAQPQVDSLFSYSPWFNAITLQVDMVILYRDDGTGNFDFSIEEQKNLFKDYLKEGQNVINNLEPIPENTVCNDSNEFYKSWGIVIDYGIQQVNNTYYWNFKNSGSKPMAKKYKGFSPSPNWYLAPLEDSLRKDNLNRPAIRSYLTIDGDQYDEVINSQGQIYNTTSVAAGQFPTSHSLKRSSQIHLPNRFLKYHLHRYAAPINYKTNWKETRKWHISDVKGFIHELGHVLGLGHSNKHHNVNKCEFSIMSQVGSAPRNYLQPSEIRKIHKNIATTNLMQFVPSSAHYGNTVILREDLSIQKTRRIYSNLKISKGQNLTIHSHIVMPDDSFIQLEKKAMLIFKGEGKITYLNGDLFDKYVLKRKAQIIKQ